MNVSPLHCLQSRLMRHALELGARTESNLTEDVTHLVAERPGSEKYRAAVGLRMHVVRPAWLEDLRRRWMAGEEVDADELLAQHRLDAFEGLTIALSGISDCERNTCSCLFCPTLGRSTLT